MSKKKLKKKTDLVFSPPHAMLASNQTNYSVTIMSATGKNCNYIINTCQYCEVPIPLLLWNIEQAKNVIIHKMSEI